MLRPLSFTPMKSIAQQEEVNKAGRVEHAAPAQDPPPALERERVGPITKLLWAVLVLAMAGIIAVKVFEPRRRELPVLYHAASFTLTDQSSRPFRDADLRGKAYICDFVFTTCGSVCP